MPDKIPLQWLLLGGGALLLGLVSVWFYFRKRRARALSSAAPLTMALEKTRQNFMGRLSQVMRGETAIDEQLLSKLEEILISADVGVTTTQKLLQGLKEEMISKGHREIRHLKEYLGDQILKILQVSPARSIPPLPHPQVLMIVGVNGVGKTTSIGKLAHRFRREGNKILLAAADTFRAGAVSQLLAWGEKVGVMTLSQKEGADPAAVAFDAVQAGQARGIDRVIIDTAGRLHTKVNLMEELKKVKRVLDKAMAGAPHEIWLVIDATQGHNALQQARQFHEALGLTGLILSKLDGTSKGGSVVGIVDELGAPIVYLGVGEKIEDLQPFDARAFVAALLA